MYPLHTPLPPTLRMYSCGSSSQRAASSSLKHMRGKATLMRMDSQCALACAYIGLISTAWVMNCIIRGVGGEGGGVSVHRLDLDGVGHELHQSRWGGGGGGGGEGGGHQSRWGGAGEGAGRVHEVGGERGGGNHLDLNGMRGNELDAGEGA